MFNVFSYDIYYWFCSHGFAVHHSDDNSVFDDDSKKVRVLVCGTEKGKHKCKNAKTAG